MFFRYNYPGIVWAVIILILLGLPPNDIPDTSFITIPHFDKIVHAFLFLILVFLLARGFVLQNKFTYLRNSFLTSSLVFGIVYGGITELLQGSLFPGRTSDIYDFLCDASGGLAGSFFFILLIRKFPSLIKRNADDAENNDLRG
jgi:VanZ family protein